MTTELFSSTGTLRYSPKLLGDKDSEKWWLVLDCDENIGRYYRHLYWLWTHRVGVMVRPAWREHVTVIRNEEPPKKDAWERYAGHTVMFWYNAVPRTNGEYWWVNVECPCLNQIRRELGLPFHPEIPFHLSFGHQGGTNGL